MENLKSKEDNEIKKIKVKSAEIVVGGNADKPCYSIKYYPIDDEECYLGYSSYNLKFVFDWLQECFDIVGA